MRILFVNNGKSSWSLKCLSIFDDRNWKFREFVIINRFFSHFLFENWKTIFSHRVSLGEEKLFPTDVIELFNLGYHWKLTEWANERLYWTTDWGKIPKSPSGGNFTPKEIFVSFLGDKSGANLLSFGRKKKKNAHRFFCLSQTSLGSKYERWRRRKRSFFLSVWKSRRNETKRNETSLTHLVYSRLISTERKKHIRRIRSQNHFPQSKLEADRNFLKYYKPQ